MFKNLKKTEFINNNPYIYSIRRGLILAIPFLMIGSFALVLKFLPIPFYQAFIQNFFFGFLVDFFTHINQITFGILSLCFIVSISMSYTKLKSNNMGVLLGSVFSSLGVFMIFIGAFTDSFQLSSFGAYGMFTAMFSAVVFSSIFCKLVESGKFSFQLYTVGSDVDFNTVLSVILPASITISIGFFFNKILTAVFGVVGLEMLFNLAVNTLFGMIELGELKSFLYVFLSNVFWFFGIHGTNVLYSVAQDMYAVGGTVDTGVLTKSFIDVFVLMGGCGTTFSLLVSILLFSKQKNTRSLAKLSALPMLFNINELLVFGLPIVYNKYFLVPFVLTPIACIISTYIAVTTGIVPMPIYEVEWVTPVIINGYQATGSIMGSFLQIFNIMLGAFIYRWFLIKNEKNTSEKLANDLDQLVTLLQESEKNGNTLTLLELKGNLGAIARMLAEDLSHIMNTKDSLNLYYQPQYDIEDQYIGAEALLRWNHPSCGMIYPPLLIGIASEAKLLYKLEKTIFDIACSDIAILQSRNINPRKISVNATGPTLQDEAFLTFLQSKLAENPGLKNVLTIELTEQMSFMLGENTENKLKAIREIGVHFAVDDFSMGHTSVKYLQSDLFDLVKLDGSLINGMLINPRNQDIISSIINMSKTMNFHVLAEFVETAEQRDTLAKYGCSLYQGYLYSPAIPLEALILRLENEERRKQTINLAEA